MVKQYSLKRDGNTFLSPHFQVKEFACHLNGQFVGDVILIEDTTIALLEQIFTATNAKYINITSGYRTPEVDRAVGGDGAPNAPHVLGLAADFVVVGQDGKQINSRDVCLTIQQMGITCDVGYMRGGTHIAYKGRRFFFDETQNCATVPGCDFYGYWGVANPNAQPASAPAPTPAPDPVVTYFPACNYGGVSIVEALINIKANSNFNYRAQIAAKNGISPYAGTASQNTQMLTLLKQGKLIRP